MGLFSVICKKDILIEILIKLKEPLDVNLQFEIIEDFKKINELSEALNTLKIIINYAMTTSANTDELVSHFIKKIYSDLEIRSAEFFLKTKVNIF